MSLDVMQLFKLLMIAKESFMRDVLVTKMQGEMVDLKTKGFDLLLSVLFYSLLTRQG